MSDPRPPRSTRPPAGRPASNRFDADDDDLPEPPRIRALRRLVTALTVASIVGVLTIAGTLVVRIMGPFDRTPAAPPIGAERIALPAGERITATGGTGTTLILATEAPDGTERLRVYDAGTGAFLRAVTITRD